MYSNCTLFRFSVHCQSTHKFYFPIFFYSIQLRLETFENIFILLKLFQNWLLNEHFNIYTVDNLQKCHHCILPQFFELFWVFLARIRFCSRIRSSSSILIFKTRIRSTHKNEKWLKQKNSRCRNYRLYYYRYIFVLAQIVHRLFARNLYNKI